MRDWIVRAALAFALLSWGIAAQAAPCVIEGKTYECVPNISSPWAYTATAASGFASPQFSSAGAAVGFTQSAFNTFFTQITYSLSYGSLSGWTLGSRGQRQYASMQINVVWSQGQPAETAWLTVVGQREPFTCPAGYTEYWPNDGGIYWAGTYEGPLCYGAKPLRIVAIDPGHGLSCAAKGLPPGTIGLTDFPASNPPPGKLKEDNLTVAIALEIERVLPPTAYKVVLTKRNVNDCPTYLQRGAKAAFERAEVFISIHANAPAIVPGTAISFPFAHGSSTHYHILKPQSKPLADLLASSVSSSLGVNNRGSRVEIDDIAVLKPNVTRMTAVLVETARVSGKDEERLHSPDAPARIAAAVRSSLDAFFGN
ncbi:N-acetylmuramoyl-L-alanine amidase [Caenimonas sp. SL110]|uniref:N-acetylmuramoyl-L-alanine amidase family protein n=1 Tax=Caenimonas sp. SL110 TaxID=1450524 RepID=UPI000653B8DF|nr:N-acetylmuramoyl-L-alanine amidase [Caenimonas sp. SL110]